MLTFDSLLHTLKQQAAFGEGKHRFGIGYERIPRTVSGEKSEPAVAEDELTQLPK